MIKKKFYRVFSFALTLFIMLTNVSSIEIFANESQNRQIEMIGNSKLIKEGDTYQNTFTEMEGLAKTYNDSRNVFILVVDENLSSISKPIWISNYTGKSIENTILTNIIQLTLFQ